MRGLLVVRGRMPGVAYGWSRATTAEILLVVATSLSFVQTEDLPRITRHPESTVIAHHHPLTLHCTAHPPTALIHWLFNGERINPDHHPGLQLRGSDLHFGHFRHGSEGSHGNDGEYRCTATTSAGTVVSRPAVVSKPVLREFGGRREVVVEAHEGGYVTIPCQAPYSHPPAVVTVLASDGRVLNQSQDRVRTLPSGSVVLTNLRQSDSDRYTCVAFNPVSGHNRSATHHIDVTVIPKPPGDKQEKTTRIVDTSTPTLQVVEGEGLVVECPLVGVGPPSVLWSRGYGTLPPGHTLGPFGNLHISSVKLRDGGTYICQTSSGQKRQVFLEVQMAPSVSREPVGGVVHAAMGDTVRLTCRGGALPAPSVSWFHNGQLYDHSSRNSVGEVHTLVLQDVTKDDAGLYVCELSNMVGQASTVLQLLVSDRPQGPQWDNLKDKPANHAMLDNPAGEVTPEDSGEGGNNRNFQLEVANNNRHRHGRKKKNGKKKNKKKKPKKKGKDKKVKLVPPSAPTISRLSETSVLVHWTVPENDGLPISLFRVQYREVRPSSGQWQTIDDDIGAKSRRYKVAQLKAGGTYKFRIAAVYSNNDNRNSVNSRRFHLDINPYGEDRPPTVTPRLVEATSFIYQNIYAIKVRWQYIPVDSSTITGFYIFYKPYGSQEEFKRETLLGAGIRKYLLTDLAPDTEYSVKMQCFNSAGASDFSNLVVKRTLPMEGQTPAEMPTPKAPARETETESPGSTRGEAGALEQPVILGIVLGVMLLLLLIFITMCWWKQRQQKRRNQSLATGSKLPDHTLYSDSLQKKHAKGGNYSAGNSNGMSSSLPNGHGPPCHHQGSLYSSTGLDPSSDMCQRSQSSGRDLYSGKWLYQGKGMMGNGTLPGHGSNNDNNFNKIRQTLSYDNVYSSQGMAPNSGQSLGSSHRSGHGKGDYPSHPYPPPSLTSFTPNSHNRHHKPSKSEGRESTEVENSHFNRHHYPPMYPGKSSVHRSRDSVDRCYEHRQGYGCGSNHRSGSRSGWREGEASHWSASPHSQSASHGGKHRRRRKRPHGERSHGVRDQATNTDLSSNGEDGGVSKSPASSVSTASDHSGHSDLTAPHRTHTPHSAGDITSPPRTRSTNCDTAVVSSSPGTHSSKSDDRDTPRMLATPYGAVDDLPPVYTHIAKTNIASPLHSHTESGKTDSRVPQNDDDIHRTKSDTGVHRTQNNTTSHQIIQNDHSRIPQNELQPLITQNEGHSRIPQNELQTHINQNETQNNIGAHTTQSEPYTHLSPIDDYTRIPQNDGHIHRAQNEAYTRLPQDEIAEVVYPTSKDAEVLFSSPQTHTCSVAGDCDSAVIVADGDSGGSPSPLPTHVSPKSSDIPTLCTHCDVNSPSRMHSSNFNCGAAHASHAHTPHGDTSDISSPHHTHTRQKDANGVPPLQTGTKTCDAGDVNAPHLTHTGQSDNVESNSLPHSLTTQNNIVETHSQPRVRSTQSVGVDGNSQPHSHTAQNDSVGTNYPPLTHTKQSGSVEMVSPSRKSKSELVSVVFPSLQHVRDGGGRGSVVSSLPRHRTSSDDMNLITPPRPHLTGSESLTVATAVSAGGPL